MRKYNCQALALQKNFLQRYGQEKNNEKTEYRVRFEYPNPRKYWSVLKTRLKKSGNELTTRCSQLKMTAEHLKVRKKARF